MMCAARRTTVISMCNLLNWLFPARCGGCGKRGDGFCLACRSACSVEHFFVGRENALAVTALGRYEGALRRAVLAMKRGRRDVAEALGRSLAIAIERDRDEVIVAAPTSPKRRAARGFDQAEALASVVRVEPRAARLRLDGASQRGAGREERLARRVRFGGGDVAGRRVLVIDDVCSTGGTLLACARALREAGAVSIRAGVAARAERSSW